MTEIDRLKKLIARLARRGGSREDSDEYLVLANGWEIRQARRPMYALEWEDFIVATSPEGEKFFEDRPDPTCSLDNALDSLPDNWLVWSLMQHSKNHWGVILIPEDCEALPYQLDSDEPEEYGAICGCAPSPSSTVCIARLRIRLAELEARER